MLVNSIGVQPIKGAQYNLSKGNPNFNGTNVYSEQGDTFAAWATKNIATAATFSIAWDLGTNILSKFSKNIDAVPVNRMASNIGRVASVFLLIGGIFRAVSNIVDKQ